MGKTFHVLDNRLIDNILQPHITPEVFGTESTVGSGNAAGCTLHVFD